MIKKLLWIDLEMTGLDPDTHHIVEVAAIVTDPRLNPIDTYEQVVFQPPVVMEKMDPWCVKQHQESGLTPKIPQGLELNQVEDHLCHLVQGHFGKPQNRHDRPIIAGNSIYQDRKFIERYMKKLDALLHYRMLDVTSFKIIFEHIQKYKHTKRKQHRALSDIQESINEFKHYLNFIKPQ